MGHVRIVSRGVDDGPLGQDTHASLDRTSRGDRVVGTAPTGFPPSPRPGGTGSPGAVPAAIIGRGSRRAQNIDLLRRVTRFLQRQHRGGVDLRQVLEDGNVGVETRAV